MTERPFLNPDEVATMLGISRDTVYSRLRDGTLPGRKLGGLWLIPAAGLLSALRPTRRRSRAAQTMDRYAHVGTDSDRAAATLLDEVMG